MTARTSGRRAGHADPLLALSDPAVRALYLALLRGRPRSTAQIRLLAPPGIDLSAALEQLEAAGLVSVGRDGLEIADPRVAVAALAHAALAGRDERGDAATAALLQLGRQRRAWEGSVRSVPAVPGSVAAGNEETWWEEVGRAQGDVALAVPELRHRRALGSDGALVALAARPARLRLLAPTTAGRAPASRKALRMLASNGTEVRLSRTVPGRLAVTGDTVAFARGRRRSEVTGIMSTAEPSIVSALTWMFEDWWSRGIPLAALDVLTLLGCGHEDAEIAELLGVSVRAVRRRVAAAMEREGARSRFELGAAWATRSRRGGSAADVGN